MTLVLQDLTRSFRDAYRYLHLPCVSCAIDLCFSFDCISYKCWLPRYYEDCVALPKHFPVQIFPKWRFHYETLFQSLKKPYRKPAKSSSGIIGFNQRKEAIWKWNLIKHDKVK